MKAANWDRPEKSLELCLDPDKFHDILNTSKTTTKCELQVFFRLAATAEIGFQTFLMVQSLYIYLKNNKPDFTFGKTKMTAIKVLKECLRCPRALGNPNDQPLIFLFVYEKKKMPLKYSSKNTGTIINW